MKPPVITPVYPHIYVRLCELARENGYALAVHGTISRDLDVVACPWTDAAISAFELAEKCRVLLDSKFDPWDPYLRPHGRLTWSLPIWWPGLFVDLSVMPRNR